MQKPDFHQPVEKKIILTHDERHYLKGDLENLELLSKVEDDVELVSGTFRNSLSDCQDGCRPLVETGFCPLL